jgi:hypothetical protein
MNLKWTFGNINGIIRLKINGTLPEKEGFFILPPAKSITLLWINGFNDDRNFS